MQALMLAAGMGKRLGKYTENNTKCMVEVAGKKLIDYAIEAVRYAGINRMILVVGYKGQNLKDYIQRKYANSEMEFIFIENKEYDVSNNIYSFYLAKEYVVQDDTILMESDLIYEKTLIKNLIAVRHKDVAAIAKYKSWMDGTVVTCNKTGYITQFIDKADMNYDMLDEYYKTVNVYKLSRGFSKNIYLPFLEAYMQAYGVNSYYETTLKVVAHLAKTQLYGYEIGDISWYEIDDVQDLDIANAMFSRGKERYNLMMSKFGGYWRYSSMLDFCYFANPYFPTAEYVKKMQHEFPVLLGAYPSGLNMQNMNAERIFDIDQKYVLVGNGASELINALGETVSGKLAVGVPTFNEYVRCFRHCEIIYIDNSKWDYGINIEAYKSACEKVNMTCIVSPDNPSGAMLTFEEVIDVVKYAKKFNTIVVMDESFIDFAEDNKKYTLLRNDILAENENLVVVKSIGKSYGVAGLRLGVLATANQKLLSDIRANMQIWNINSFAEYFLQTFNLYAKDYKIACEKIAKERKRMIEEINKLPNVKAYDSQANYIMVWLQNQSSYDFCVDCLENYNILIKDLSSKNYFNGNNYIRVAVKDTHENNQLVKAMRELIK